MSALISSAELASRLNTPGLVILNGSWHMPAEKRDAKAEHANAHVPGAVFFDIDAISDTSSSYPHMLPSAAAFEKAVSALGISNISEIVVYDAAGLFSAARVWWMFRVFGHDNIKVLDGGLPKWVSEKHPVESGNAQITAGNFKASLRPELLRSFYEIALNVTQPREQVIDARSAGRFNGTEPEPRDDAAVHPHRDPRHSQMRHAVAHRRCPRSQSPSAGAAGEYTDPGQQRHHSRSLTARHRPRTLGR